MLLYLTGSNRRINYAPRSQKTLVRNRIGSPMRAAEEIGFTAEVPLEEGLRRLIAWRASHKAAVEAQRMRACEVLPLILSGRFTYACRKPVHWEDRRGGERWG